MWDPDSSHLRSVRAFAGGHGPLEGVVGKTVDLDEDDSRLPDAVSDPPAGLCRRRMTLLKAPASSKEMNPKRAVKMIVEINA